MGRGARQGVEFRTPQVLSTTAYTVWCVGMGRGAGSESSQNNAANRTAAHMVCSAARWLSLKSETLVGCRSQPPSEQAADDMT